jgi:hypothetical protein
MSAPRAYENFPLVRDEEGRSAQQIKCASCEAVAFNRCNRGVASNATLAGAFSRKGWTVDLGRARHQCPDCKQAERIKGRAQQTERKSTVKIEKATLGTILPTTQSALAKAVVMELLVGNYDLETHDYKRGWSDARIAKEAGISVEFVAKRREEDFGPATPPKPPALVELSRQIEALSRLSQNLSTSIESVSGALANIRSAAKTINETIDVIGRFVAESQKADQGHGDVAP